MKTLTLLLCIILTFGVLVACSNVDNPDDIAINVMLVDGAPLLSVAHMMSDDFAGISGYNLSFMKTNDVDTLVAALLNQEPDFAIVPINVAAMMFNNGSGYRLAAITTWGLMHIVSNRDISSLEDLKGETVVAFGRAGTPGITLRSILTQNNIEFIEPESVDFTPDPNKVSIIYLTAPSDVRDAIATGMYIGGKPVEFGLLAEPVATAITGFANNMGRPDFSARINLQTEWARHNNDEIYPQAALIFHERLLLDHNDLVNEFIDTVEQSSIYANNNPIETGDLAVSLGSISFPNGTIVGLAHSAGRLPMNFTHAVDAKLAVITFLQVIMDENPNLIGGRMPEDGFYYVKE